MAARERAAAMRPARHTPHTAIRGSTIRRVTSPVIVSAASAEYFRCLVQLALSIERTQPRGALRCIAYDLGFSAAQRQYFERRFRGWELRSFDFERYPPHLRIRDRLVNTNAWKPVIVRDVLA